MSLTSDEKTFNFVATNITFDDDSFFIYLTDGRTLSVPYDLVPSLSRANQSQREKFELIGMGTSIHWPELDEDLSIEGLVLGRKIIDWKKPLKKA